MKFVNSCNLVLIFHSNLFLFRSALHNFGKDFGYTNEAQLQQDLDKCCIGLSFLWLFPIWHLASVIWTEWQRGFEMSQVEMTVSQRLAETILEESNEKRARKLKNNRRNESKKK